MNDRKWCPALSQQNNKIIKRSIKLTIDGSFYGFLGFLFFTLWTRALANKLGPSLYLLYIPCFHYSSFEELNNWEVSGTIFQAYDEWLGCTAYSCGALRVSVTRVGGADACKESSGWFFEHED